MGKEELDLVMAAWYTEDMPLTGKKQKLRVFDASPSLSGLASELYLVKTKTMT
jgi:hypothetical protein